MEFDELGAAIRRQNAKVAAAFGRAGMPADVAATAAAAVAVARYWTACTAATSDAGRERAARAGVMAREALLEVAAGLVPMHRDAFRIARLLANNGAPYIVTAESLRFLANVAAAALFASTTYTAAAMAAGTNTVRAACVGWAQHRDTLAKVQAIGMFARAGEVSA